MATCWKHSDVPDMTCATCHAGALVGKAAKEGRLKPAPTVVAEIYGAEIDRMLDALGVKRAFVTDWSRVGDFDNLDFGEGVGPQDMLSRAFGFPVAAGDYIIDVAKRLREAGRC